MVDSYDDFYYGWRSPSKSAVTENEVHCLQREFVLTLYFKKKNLHTLPAIIAAET